MKKYKMLFAGESWLTHNMGVKGWDDFSVGGYGTEIDRIHAAMDEFAEITHLPSHLVGEKFPSTMEELKTYDVVILSDVGANTLLLQCFYQRGHCIIGRQRGELVMFVKLV